MQDEVKYRTSLVSKSLPIKKRIFAIYSNSATKAIQYALQYEEKYKTYETRSIQIIITPPVWASVWAMVGYVILLVLVMGIIFRIIMLHKQKKVSDEKHGSSLIRHTTYVHR